MKAAVLNGYNSPLVVEDLDIAPPGPGEVRVRLAACGVCHSDLHAMRGSLQVPLPIVLGHEGAGIVDASGPGVSSCAPGDRVVLSWVASCGSCFYCHIGRPELCEPANRAGARGVMLDGGVRLHRPNGDPVHHFILTAALAEYAIVPATGVVRLADDVPLDLAALLGCAVLTGFGAVFHTARLEPGSTAVVIGTGGIGLNIIQAAALSGAARVIAVDRVASRLERAAAFGATDLVDGSRQDVVRTVRGLTEGGRGADYAFEAVGQPETISQAYRATRPAGVCVVVGVAARDAEVQLNAFSLPSQEKVLTGSWYGSSRPAIDIPRLLALYRAGRLKLDEQVGRRYALADVQAAFDALAAGEPGRGLVVMD